LVNSLFQLLNSNASRKLQPLIKSVILTSLTLQKSTYMIPLYNKKGFTLHYIGDILSLNNKKFTNCLHLTYPAELVVKQILLNQFPTLILIATPKG